MSNELSERARVITELLSLWERALTVPEIANCAAGRQISTAIEVLQQTYSGSELVAQPKPADNVREEAEAHAKEEAMTSPTKPAPRPDPLKPRLELLMKLGSIAVHTDELLSPGGHNYDMEALKPMLRDPEVREWIKDMGVYLPVKRRK